MEIRKIIDAIDDIKDARGEAALVLQLMRWYLIQTVLPPVGGNEGGVPVGGNEGGFPSGTEGGLWTSLLRFAQKQALVGVMFEGIKRLPKELSPKGRVLLEWVAQSEAIRRQNIRLDRATADIYNMVRARGYRCCILKGQGNALLYDAPHARTPGDVDVWCPTPPSPAGRASLRALAAALTEGHGAIGHESYNHIEMTVNGIPVELHPTPALLNSPLHNRRLQRWLEANAKVQCENMVELPDDCGQIAIPTREFNLVYQLLHLYHHHLFEGIGLRQFVDYALQAPLQLSPTGGGHSTKDETGRGLNTPPTGGSWREACGIEGDLGSILKHLGIYHFAGAVMYVLHEVFAIPEDQLLVPMDKKRGQLLLADILHGGNFGHYDTRFAKTALGHNLQRICRDLRLMRYYPAETLCEPFFRLWHWAWRKRQGA